MLLSCNQNAGQNPYIKRANRCLENVAQFRYFGTTITNQNLIQEEIKRRSNLGNAYYHSVQKCLSRFRSKNITIRIYGNISVPVVLYVCEACSLTLEEGYRLRVFEKRC
jgi:ribosomal protein S2